MDFSSVPEMNGYRIWYCTNQLELAVKVGLSAEADALAIETGGRQTCTSIFANNPNAIAQAIPKPTDAGLQTFYAAVGLVRGGVESVYALATADLTGCRSTDTKVCPSQSAFKSNREYASSGAASSERKIAQVPLLQLLPLLITPHSFPFSSPPPPPSSTIRFQTLPAAHGVIRTSPCSKDFATASKASESMF
jgi:hypothetical protein